MKKSLLFFILFIAVICKAQPTLTSSNFNPMIGEIFTLANTAYTSPGASGTNQFWNYSALSSTAATTSTYVAPSAVSGGSAYPSANIAGKDGSGNAGFYLANSSLFQSWGTKTSASVVNSNPENYMQFPFTYGNTFTDNFAGTFTTTSAFYRKGSVTVTADGSGTLAIPSGTFTNVLRIHFVENYQDSANFGFPYIINYNNDEYIWYQPGIHSALLSISTLSTSIPSTTQFATYLNSVPTGINSESAVAENSILFPNPASHELNIKIEQSYDRGEIKIYDLIGHLIVSRDLMTSESINKIDVSSLNAGIYFSELQIDGVISKRQRIVIER